MKRKLLLVLLIAGISSGVFTFMTLANSTCRPKISTNSIQKSYSFTLPIKIASTGLKFQLRDHLKIGIDCICTPCCQSPEYQYAALDIKGMAGNEVIWTGHAYKFEDEQTPFPVCMLPVEFEKEAGSWLPILTGSLFGISADTTSLDFVTFPICECRWLKRNCMGNTLPLFLPHKELVITPGSTISFTVYAKDPEGYLDSFAPINNKGSGLLPIKMLEQHIDGGVGQATFTLSYTKGMTDGKVGVDVSDKCGAFTNILIPVVVDHPPVLTLERDSTRWEDGAYVVRFKVSDPDCKGPFAGGDNVRLEVKATGGSESHPWNPDGIGCDSGPYAVAFFPNRNTDEPQRLKITATDWWGVKSSLSVNIPNIPPTLSVSSSEITAVLGKTKEATVTATDPDGDPITLAVSGPGGFSKGKKVVKKLEGVKKASGTWSWTPWGRDPWQLVGLKATDKEA